MLLEELDKAWRERERTLPLDLTPTFQDEGLVLGAGAILLAAAAERGRLIRLDGVAEARLLVLLSAAYGRIVEPGVLGHVRRAAARWNEGDAALASVHLALAGLGALPSPRDCSRRLFLTERLIEAGVEFDALLRALDLGDSLNILDRAYNPDQPRVPAGSGRESGQWTSGDEAGVSGDEAENSGDQPGAAAAPSSPPSRPGGPPSETPKAPSAEDAGVDALSGPLSPAQEAAAREAAERALRALRVASKLGLEGLSEEELVSLGGLAATLTGPAVFLGVLLTPTNKTIDKEQPVPGRPGFFYEHLPGEVGWHITFVNDRGEGIEVSAGPDGMYRDAHGQAFGRLLPNALCSLRQAARSRSRPRTEFWRLVLHRQRTNSDKGETVGQERTKIK